MRTEALLLALSAPTAAAFAPPTSLRTPTRLSAFDPSSLHDVARHADAFHGFISSLTLADVDVDAVSSALSSVPVEAAPAVPAAGDAAAATAAAAAATTNQGSGPFGFLTLPIEGLLKFIHVALTSMGMSADAWGVSIIVMTLVIKLVTFPLTKQQLESTNKMQALQPTVKALQNKYQSNPEVMNQKIAEVYQDNDVNPLAGCLPAIVQLPVFIGLYRAVLNLAKENLLDEPFLFLPNLEGPIYDADPSHASDWLFKNWVDGVPSLGWDDTIAFLCIPIFLTVSQVVSMNLMQPKTDDPAQQQSNAVLKVLPFMIGFFSINVPAALGVYWVVNNIVTTATTLYIRSTMPTIEVAGGGGGAGAAVVEARAADFNPTPMNERAVGFGGSSADTGDAMRTITPVDAEIVEEGVVAAEDEGPDLPPAPKAKRGKKKKRRKN